MIERHGRDQGQRDGMADAMLDRPCRPRPTLSFCLISNAYREAYMSADHRGYEHMERRLEAERAQRLEKQARQKQTAKAPTNRHFDQGWRDGFAGKTALPSGLSDKDLNAYERGHRLGAQQYDFQRSKQLHQHALRQKIERAQDHSR